MKRKDYQKPTMNIVKLQHHGMLMTSTQSESAGVQNYEWNEYEEE